MPSPEHHSIATKVMGSFYHRAEKMVQKQIRGAFWDAAGNKWITYGDDIEGGLKLSFIRESDGSFLGPGGLSNKFNSWFFPFSFKVEEFNAKMDQILRYLQEAINKSIPEPSVEILKDRVKLFLTSSDDCTDDLEINLSDYTGHIDDNYYLSGRTFELFMEAMVELLPIYEKRKSQWNLIKNSNLDTLRAE